MIRMSYNDIRDSLQPGDLVAFGGNGLISDIIKAVTKSPVSHVGIVLYKSTIDFKSLVMIAESTTLGDGKAGVDLRRLSTRVAKYDGNMWVLPLRKMIGSPQPLIDYRDFVLRQVGKEYDAPQAILSAVDTIPDTDEDLTRLFCSELATAALRIAGQIPSDINASEQTPIDVCRFDCFGEPIQIKGRWLDMFGGKA